MHQISDWCTRCQKMKNPLELTPEAERYRLLPTDSSPMNRSGSDPRDSEA
jgi:hypothetical protein